MRKLKSPNRQRGAVLLTVSMLLVMLTILALAAASMNSTQTRIATNTADNLTAYQTSEASLAEALAALSSGTYNKSNFVATSGTGGLYMGNPYTPLNYPNLNWGSSTVAVQSTFTGESSSNGAYVIELLPSIIKPGQSMSTPTQVYRVTSRGLGASGNSSVILQGTVQLQQ